MYNCAIIIPALKRCYVCAVTPYSLSKLPPVISVSYIILYVSYRHVYSIQLADDYIPSPPSIGDISRLDIVLELVRV